MPEIYLWIHETWFVDRDYACQSVCPFVGPAAKELEDSVKYSTCIQFHETVYGQMSMEIVCVVK